MALESLFRPTPRKAAWLALVALFLVCSLLLLLYRGMPASWDQNPSSSLPAPTNTIIPEPGLDSDGKTITTSDNNKINASTTSNNHSNNPSDRRCRALANPGNVQFVVKTGATEIYEKLPTQLLTTLGCVNDFLIFSDLDEQIGPYHIQDALADFNATLKDTLPDFQLYRLQQEYRRTGQDMANLKKDGGGAAWTLDKYKFLHLVEKTWTERPGREWYFFIETDTYVVWSNLVLWLRQISPPTDPLYFGSIAYVGGEPFAHGGSGFLISGPLLEKLVGQNPGMANRYDDAFLTKCCGDFVLAHTIRTELGIGVRNHWPQINGEKPVTLRFGSMQWCQPIVTMHHLHPRERTAIFDFEQTRPDLTQPLLFRELSYLPFPTDNLRTQEDDWDNLSNIRIQFANNEVPTLESCRDACLGLDGCFQWRFTSGGQCDVATDAFVLGVKRIPEEGKRWISGWNTEYISRWRDEHLCERAEWVMGY